MAAIEGITAYCTILEDADEALFLLCAAIEKTVDVLKRQSNHPHKFIGANLNSPNKYNEPPRTCSIISSINNEALCD